MAFIKTVDVAGPGKGKTICEECKRITRSTTLTCNHCGHVRERKPAYVPKKRAAYPDLSARIHGNKTASRPNKASRLAAINVRIAELHRQLAEAHAELANLAIEA